MTATKDMPNYVRGFAAAGAAELRGVGKKLQGWQLKPGKALDPTLAEPEALAADLLAKLAYPEHAFDTLSRAARDRIAAVLGLPPKSKWKPSAPVPPETPSFKRPSWEKDVYEVLFRRREVAPPVARGPASGAATHTGAWPELATLARWAKTKDREAFTWLLAGALGEGWRPLDPVGDEAFARVYSEVHSLAFVAVPGGAFTMGLSPGEQKSLQRQARPLGPEAQAHARELAKLARPTRRVKVGPFLCAETPLLEAHGALAAEGDAANPHGVLRLRSEAAAAAVRGTGRRLVSEAEWEWLARGGGAQAWLSGDEAPEAWAERVLSTPLPEGPRALGVLGLGWGEWVDDGWHPTYRGAPATSAAWGPMSRPELARGGALSSWPWQSGEALFLHAAARDRVGPGTAMAVRLVVDLPPRRAAVASRGKGGAGRRAGRAS